MKQQKREVKAENKKFSKFKAKSRPKVSAKHAYRDSVKEDSPYDEKPQRFNDPLWYAKNEQMLKDAASYSYNNPIGTPLSRQTLKPISGTTMKANVPMVPSLMAVRICPTIGVSVDASSPANLAANNIYAYVRYQNSGAKNYDQADLMLYLLAMDSLYSCWNWLKRIYGYINLYSQFNLTMPKVFAQADHVSFKSIQSNLADFRLFLNRTAAQISSFCVPAVMPYFIRHSWMYSNIYKDSDNNKAQMFMFTPEYFYKYSSTGLDSGGSLQVQFLRTYPSSLTRDFQELQNYITELINAVAYSADIGVMSGDILKAYGQDKLFKLTPVDPDYVVTPVYNEEVLNQIHNSSILPFVPQSENALQYAIKQDPNTGYLIWNPSIDPVGMYETNGAIINMPWDDVTPANTMVGTRLTAGYRHNGATNKLSISYVGSEYVCKLVIYSAISQSDSFETDAIALPWIYINGVPEQGVELVGRLSNFDWHPIFPLFTATETTGVWQLDFYVGDFTNYTVMDEDDLKKLHLTALMSLFNIPQLASF